MRKISGTTMYYRTDLASVVTEITYSFKQLNDTLIMLGTLSTPPSSPLDIRLDSMDLIPGEKNFIITASGTLQQEYYWTKTSDSF